MWRVVDQQMDHHCLCRRCPVAAQQCNAKQYNICNAKQKLNITIQNTAMLNNATHAMQFVVLWLNNAKQCKPMHSYTALCSNMIFIASSSIKTEHDYVCAQFITRPFGPPLYQCTATLHTAHRSHRSQDAR